MTPALKKIAFIYTELQLSILQSANDRELADFVLLHPLHRTPFADQPFHAIRIGATDQQLTLRKARHLLAATWAAVAQAVGDDPFELWLASCDNPIGQLLINHPRCQRTVLIEDGIGSYVAHAPLDMDRGFRFTARKLKYFLWLFPYYRSLFGIGSHNAQESWALHSSAFPRAERRPNLISIERLHVAFECNATTAVDSRTAVYLDQPLLSNGLLRESELRQALKNHVRNNADRINRYLIKKHPATSPSEFNHLLQIFHEVADARIDLFEETRPIESLCLSEQFTPAEVFSFYSSALYTIKSLRRDIPVVSIARPPTGRGARSLRKYILAMRNVGIELEESCH